MIKAVIFDMFETLVTHYESPKYFGEQIAKDSGIEPQKFQIPWRKANDEMSTGKLSLEQILEIILKEHNRYSKELLDKLVKKRTETKKECFRHLHPQIIPMLSKLKEKDIRIGLISNCFSEEAAVIRESELIKYFDAVYLSWEQGIQKPDEELFHRCTNCLEVNETECIYVGDGGSFELETAKKLGMSAYQAMWYRKEGTTQRLERKEGFVQLDTPFDLFEFLTS